LKWCIIGLFLKFGGMITFIILVLTIMRNEVVINQPIPFHKPNKKGKK
jgi:hypothetical protein